MGEKPLVATMEEIFSSPGELMISILLDGSGSVTNFWGELIELTIGLVEKLKGIDVQLIQFSGIARTECPFTRNQDVLIKTLKDMKIMGNNTNTFGALDMVRKSLIRSCSETTVPVVFLLTDGNFDGQHPKDAITELLKLAPQPRIVGIGIGAGVSVDSLRKMMPGQAVFHTQSYGQLNSFIQSLTVERKEASDPCIKVIFHQKITQVQKSKADLKLYLQVEPDAPLVSLPPKTTINFLPNTFFYGESVELPAAVPKGFPYELTVTLKVKANAIHYGEFPEKIWYEASIPGSPRGKYRGYVQMLLGWLAQDFVYDPEPQRPMNILLWGPMGCGKTAFINGILMLFSSHQEVSLQLTSYRADKHVTRSYTCNPVSSFLDESTVLGQLLKDIINIQLWDVWGLSPTTYKKLGITHFLEGRVPDRTVLNDDPCRGSPNPNNVIDGVIFVIPIGTSQQPELLETLGENIATALDFGIRPVVVINFLDTISSQEEMDNAFQTIFIASHLSERDIFKIDNYVNEKFRNMGKDLQYWKILQQVYAEGVKHFKRNPREKSAYLPPPSPIANNMANLSVSSPVRSPVSPDQNPDSKYCKTEGCANFDQVVSTKRCGECGKTPEAPVVSAAKVCGNHSCPDFNKPVTGKFCSECGSPPISAAPQTPQCRTPSCTLFGKPISGKFCTECGTPANPKPSGESSSPSPSKTSGKCINSSCRNYQKDIDTRLNSVCPFCGRYPSK